MTNPKNPTFHRFCWVDFLVENENKSLYTVWLRSSQGGYEFTSRNNRQTFTVVYLLPPGCFHRHKGMLYGKRVIRVDCSEESAVSIPANDHNTAAYIVE